MDYVLEPLRLACYAPRMCRGAHEHEITPAMIEAGVDAFILAYDREEEGLDNLRRTIAAVLVAGFDSVDQPVDDARCVPGKLS